MINLKVWIDQLLKKILYVNDHAHPSKLKKILSITEKFKYEKKISNTQNNEQVITTPQNDVIIVDQKSFSSAPEGATSVIKYTKKRRKKFFPRKIKDKGP